MDPLSALAIAAAVVQFLDIGGKLLLKGWEKYERMQREKPGDDDLEERGRDSKEAFDGLSLQTSGIQQVFTNMASQPATPAQANLRQLLSRCNDISNELDNLRSQLKPPSNRKVNTEMHVRNHASGNSSRRRPRRNIPEEDCQECQKRREEEKAEFERNATAIERITKQLRTLRPSVIDSVILCLWDDSKRSQRWELYFNNQLNKAIELLERAQGSTTNSPALSTEEGQGEKMPSKHASELDEEVITLRQTIQPLIQPENGPSSLKQLAGDIVRTLGSESRVKAAIQDELVAILWEPDWKLDSSMADQSSTNIDTAMVAAATAAGIEFDTIQLKENAIPKSFEMTYLWIFQEEPPVDRDIPRWHSFPKWLQDDVHKVYWITGKPGSGKSTIMKLILQHESLRDSLSIGSLRPLLVKYYAWNPGSTLQKSLEGLKRTIIYQALHQCPELAPSLAPRRWAFCQVLRSTSGLPPWSSWEIEESFEALLSLCGKTIKLALFVDGLDEFNTPPTEVINCIRYIKARCDGGLKVCAASRPWTEFHDEFSEGPMLQMHLQTQGDIRTFITKRFAENRGFVEQQQLNPRAASQLLLDIGQRANGVFLWVSIVTQHLLSLLSEGESISQARQTLEGLPTDLSSLYDAIWAGIRPQHLADAAYLIQVLRAADGPLAWFTMWLIEESRLAPVDIDRLPTTSEWKGVARQSLKRKLAARTKCILEVSGDVVHDWYVDFIHRTARDWALQPDRWQLISSLSDGDFDPHLSILQADTLILSDSNYRDRNRTAHIVVWDAIARALWNAGEVKDTPTNRERIMKCLHSFEAHKRFSCRLKHGALTTSLSSDLYGWYLSEGSARWNISNTLHGLAAQFAVLPYIKAALPRDRKPFVYHDNVLGLLENAIFGYRYFYRELSQDDVCPTIPRERRLATVKYLLEEGVYQSKVHSRNGIYSLKEAIEEARVSSTDPGYYDTVVEYLDQRGLKSRAKTIGLRMRFCLDYMVDRKSLTYS